MPRTVETTVYSIEELPESAKESARAWFRASCLEHECCLADYLTMGFPDYFARQACRFPGLSGRFHEAQAECRTAVVASSRYAAPALRFGPSGDPPPSARLIVSMAVSGAFGHGPIARRIVVAGA